MSATENMSAVARIISENFDTGNFIKLTLSNKRTKSNDLDNVFVRPVMIKNQALLSLFSGTPPKM